ncbi:hypothetical protein [Ottowia testudinis]|uniref:Uncharacterized protein n=1 Tax=Ottowia testudinis TaxID=2816950 RepID=A0A975CI53_9BURK|nr:hypothetical protein [Ottowia testudinis]QTD43828.1 hypothetical protein J1M35_11780 [Ottowia testudinis]
MKIQDLELHDALVSKVEVELGRISMFIKCYLEENSTKRDDLQIEFSGVRSSNLLMDHGALLINGRAGNINYWIPKNDGVTYIYLVDGFISIDSQSISVVYQGP